MIFAGIVFSKNMISTWINGTKIKQVTLFRLINVRFAVKKTNKGDVQMGSSDDILRNPWENAGGEKITEWEDGRGIENQIESGKEPDTRIPGLGW
jgi:hypothetical protein